MTDENITNLKAHDNDKYLALHFAPADKKAQLAALFNFHYLISHIPVEVSETMIGMIKFQWWRDVLEEIKDGKPPRPHPVLLGLQHSNVNYSRLLTIIDNYEKLLDWQPRTLEELENFTDQTQGITFEQAANILETTYALNPMRAYAYTFMARKLAPTNPEMSTNLFAQSRELSQGNAHNVFAVITNYYNKTPKGRRWKLLLKLAFSRVPLL